VSHPEPLLTRTLIKAARGLLDIDQWALAEHAGISRKTLSLIEAATGVPNDPRRIANLVLLQRCFEDKLGVQFIFASKTTGEGVRLVRPRKG
jgi:DNA-binding XRE family transcriptional regulator